MRVEAAVVVGSSLASSARSASKEIFDDADAPVVVDAAPEQQEQEESEDAKEEDDEVSIFSLSSLFCMSLFSFPFSSPFPSSLFLPCLWLSTVIFFLLFAFLLNCSLCLPSSVSIQGPNFCFLFIFITVHHYHQHHHHHHHHHHRHRHHHHYPELLSQSGQPKLLALIRDSKLTDDDKGRKRIM